MVLFKVFKTVFGKKSKIQLTWWCIFPKLLRSTYHQMIKNKLPTTKLLFTILLTTWLAFIKETPFKDILKTDLFINLDLKMCIKVWNDNKMKKEGCVSIKLLLTTQST
jgi:hypothetical protein